MEVRDERENLANDICYRLNDSGIDMQRLKGIIYIAMQKYEITSRSTEIAVLDSEQNDEVLKRFLINKKVAGRTEKTLKYYAQSCRIIMESIGKTYKEITADDIRCYMALRLTRDHVSKTTIANEIRCFSSFCTWLRNEEYIIKNPMTRVETIKQAKTKKIALTELEIEQLRSAIKDERERLIFEMLLSTGCRVSELVQILLNEIDGNKILIHGKGQKDRYCYLNAKALIAIEAYMAKRTDSNPYLFPKGKNLSEGLKDGTYKPLKDRGAWWKNAENVIEGHMDNGTVEVIMRKLAKRAGVEKANPHKLRRTFATMALKHGMPIMQVSKLLGHEQLSTTQIYLDLSEDDLAQAHKKYVV
jgi:integrase/recombinase XerD